GFRKSAHYSPRAAALLPADEGPTLPETDPELPSDAALAAEDRRDLRGLGDLRRRDLALRVLRAKLAANACERLAQIRVGGGRVAERGVEDGLHGLLRSVRCAVARECKSNLYRENRPPRVPAEDRASSLPPQAARLREACTHFGAL